MLYELLLMIFGFIIIMSILVIGFTLSEYNTKKYIKKHLKNGITEKQIIDLLLEG